MALRRELGIFVVIAAAFVLLPRLTGRAALQAPPLPDPAALRATTSRSAPDFALPDVAGGALTLAELRGQLVLLNFWATWCPPCRKELPSLERLSRALGPEGLRVVAVSLDAGAPEPVARFAARRGLSFPVLHDPSGATANRYGVFAYPTSYVIDRDGRLLHGSPSAWDWDHEDARTWLRKLLAQ